MRVIIIPDFHTRHYHVKQILSLEDNYDKLIHLGDSFDSFKDTVEDNVKTAIWLKGKLQDKKNIMLAGNHDSPYRFPNNYHLRCSGFTERKAEAINQVLTQEDWAKLKFFHIENGILFSHAGLSQNFVDLHIKDDINARNIAVKLDNLAAQARNLAKAGQYSELLGAGHSRGGEQRFGGITWCDFSEFVPIEGLPQILAHSTRPSPAFKIRDGDKQVYAYADDKKVEWNNIDFRRGFGLDLDSHLNHYAVMEYQNERNKLSIYQVLYDKDWYPGAVTEVIGNKLIREFKI